MHLIGARLYYHYSLEQQNQKAQFLNYVQGQDKTSADYMNMITSTNPMQI